jgi:hypothetical protein
MSISPPPQPSSGLQLFQTALNLLAALILVLGLIAGINMITGADNIVANTLMPLAFFGSDAIINMISPLFTGFIINLGIITIIVTIVLSALVYGIGRLIGYIARLEARLARLEARGT